MRGTPTIFYRSLNRKFHVFGVDRSMFYIFVALCLPLIFAGRLSLKVDLIALVIFIILHIIGVLITRADSQMMDIYRRHIHYKKYYAAHPGIHAKVPLLRNSVPFFEGKRGLV